MTLTTGGDLLSGLEDALEGRLHKTIERVGIERARVMALTAADRRCVEAANLVMTDEDLLASFVHAGFALTALPHRRIEESEWVREAGGLTLRVESGRDERGVAAGIPYGVTP
jgi:hypothetical protein